MRGRDLLIGVAATVGFLGIVKLTGPSSETAPPASQPQPPAPLPPPPPGPEPVPAPGEISVLSLLGEMDDLGHLARFAKPRFRAGMTASTDRRSRAPGYEDWFANDDFVTETQPNLVRVETGPDGKKRYVLLDATGPGAVVRIWTATPTGTLRLTIDDDPRPVLEAPMRALLAGELSPYVQPLAHLSARGYNLYFPFPYAKRCLITVDDIVSPDPFNGRPTAKLYYQVGYRTYPTAVATAVRPFSAAELARATGAIRRVAQRLSGELAAPVGGSAGAAATSIPIPATALERGRPSVTRIPAPPGGGRITELRLATPERAVDRLRATWVSIAFDGEETVRAPLIELFGTGPGINPYQSLPMTVSADGSLVCRFPMPFRTAAVVSLSHTGNARVELSGTIRVEPAPFDETTLLFHARWRPRTLIPTRPFSDWHVGTITGAGHHVGTALGVENPPGTAWWGEGDEKIFVDGETFPSFFGTGTEDYFGYAWSQTETFAHPYHAQTAAPTGGFAGLYAMNRFHILDPIPFERNLRFDLEIWHWSQTSIAVDATLYWYARPGATDDF